MSGQCGVRKWSALLFGAMAWFVIMPIMSARVTGQTPASPAAPPNRKTVIAGAHYRGGWVRRLFLGEHYRHLWTTPVEVDVLDLSRFAGGLTPTGCGGRRQTKSLRFLGRDKHQYVFRSVDKDPAMALPPELRATFARDVIQDQISSAHPGGPLVVAPLLDTAGVLHAEPRMTLLPDDDARLKPFDCVRPGFLLGMIEERPTEPPDNETGFAGAADLAGTKKLFEHLEHDSRHRVDSRAFLAARLIDVFVGDWDRHRDQWRWARFDSAKVHVWRPVPSDRDQAFSRFDGALLWLAKFYVPEVTSFGDDYPKIWRITLTGQVVDRRLLVDLDKPAWDSVAQTVHARLTNPVIDNAVRRLPPEYFQINGAALTHALRRRRDALLRMSDRYYALLSGVVEIHGTDERDIADIERLADGRLAVQLSAPSGRAPFYSRTFDRHETHEVRLYMHGGDDRLTVRGSSGSGPRLRVIGGGGDDDLMDSSRAGKTHLYDARGDNRFVKGPGTSVDRRRYDEPPHDTSTLGRPRDWGSRRAPTMWLGYSQDVGLFLGGGVTRTSYDFRQLPYRSYVKVRAGYATAAQTYRAEFTGEFRGIVRPAVVGLDLRASGIEVLHFYGFGNETAAPEETDPFKVKQQQYRVEPSLELQPSRSVHVSIGPVFKFAHTHLDAGTFIETTRPYGVRNFSQVGATTEIRFDTRDRPVAATRGISATLGGSFYPGLLDVTTAFGEGHAEASSYLTAPVPLHPTLALRVGGKKVFGTYPFHEAARIGGATTVRGFVEDRFTGDAALYGNAELRLFLTKFFVLLPGELGVFGLGDAGRVFRSGEVSDRWHGSAGGGLWLAFLSRANTVAVYGAQSVEGTRIYARAGFAF